MQIYADINEPTVRRTFQKHVTGTRGLTVYDKKLRGFGLKVAPDGTKTFFVRTVRETGSQNVILGKAGKIAAAEARRQAVAALEAAKTDRVNGPLFRDHAEHFMRRQARRWKPSTQENNRHLLNRYILPFFGDLRVADIAPADVRRWFDSMSATPANANRALPVLSVECNVLRRFAPMVAEIAGTRWPNSVEYAGVLQTMSLPPSSAPIATGWSNSCRAGFAPARRWRLSTAHGKQSASGLITT